MKNKDLSTLVILLEHNKEEYSEALEGLTEDERQKVISNVKEQYELATKVYDDFMEVATKYYVKWEYVKGGISRCTKEMR